ncbi:bestrophin family ion channel [Erythrobacter alti]|uniref:bestrophin family ion channel n=1 Tax=Erythrobacter alti TaxID=1896145 RepID=UPI0030F49C0F
MPLGLVEFEWQIWGHYHAMIMERISRIGLIINGKTVLIAALAVISTWVSLQVGAVADFPLTIISTAVIFPIVFSIGHAYKRRENALDDYGTIKAHGRAMYFAARDWLPDGDEAARRARLDAIEACLIHLLSSCRAMFKGERDCVATAEREVYASFSELSVFVKMLREDGLPSGECSRCNQYLSKMIVAFESVKHIYQYRTPRTLRAFSDFFIVLLPLLYGPYFAYLAVEYEAPSMTYVMPALFAIILAGLDNIQTHLEDPFDQIGPDDVAINAEKFVELLGCGEVGETSEDARELLAKLEGCPTT